MNMRVLCRFKIKKHQAMKAAPSTSLVIAKFLVLTLAGMRVPTIPSFSVCIPTYVNAGVLLKAYPVELKFKG